MKSFIISLIVVLFPVALSAQWYSLDQTQTGKTPPVVQILSDDETGTVIKVDISSHRPAFRSRYVFARIT
jgi:hypothetical protein